MGRRYRHLLRSTYRRGASQDWPRREMKTWNKFMGTIMSDRSTTDNDASALIRRGRS